ncbi:hypothetical protein BDV96DRAFT_567058 [Lophiotrema nucula]|uniref:Rhodopsin domain-containing protein n=1 Tax=Lophiotrema nucula TaxID=690887 RepID=A0A6A5ZL43_9PLEO|nr:hypothetical protein BDV96DRAFT_567058 [Lophiotrema nucula]
MEAPSLWVRADSLFPRAGGLIPPSSVLTQWPAPNYVDPETRSWAAPVVCIVFLALAFGVYVLRMWARLVIAKNAGLDDWLMSAAMIPLVGSTIAVVLGITIYGFQWHAWDQTAETYITTRQITLAIEVLYIVATSLIKVSILCFYRRITHGSISKTFIYWVWASILFVIAYCITFVFVIIFSCTPVSGYWHLFDLKWRLTHELKCHNEGAEIVAVVVISTALDFLICALPVVLVWNLQIPRRQKAALIGIFGLGLVTCVCGILRMYYAIYVYYYTYDITWYAFYGWIWTALEADLGVICASAPALKVFFHRYFNLSGNRSTNGYSNGKKASNGQPSTESGKWKSASYPVPMDRIKVSTGLNVTVEDRDETGSQWSDASTRELTALPNPHSSADNKSETFTPRFIEGCRTVRAAFRPESQSSTREKSRHKNVTRGT